jgi:uncharacterized membrane protein (DUF4010 family)
MLEIDALVVRNFLIALAIGALVGIEREKHKATEHPNSFGGVRTFILLAQIGAVSSWLSLHLQSPWIFIVALLGVISAVMTAYVIENRRTQALGLTSQISAITVCLLGGAVMYGYAEIAVVMAIVTSAILTFKQPLHGFVARLGTDDLVAAVKLAIATFIVLPLLPNTPIDPWLIFNPYKLWLLVILISGLSLLGYVAVRILGQARGHAVAGLAGGLVSSTAVSLSFARLSRLAPTGVISSSSAPETAASGLVKQQNDALAAGILLAWFMMCLRLLIMVGLLSWSLFQQLWPMLAAMALVSAVAAFGLFQHSRQQTHLGGSAQHETAVKVTNPFSLLAAGQFGLLFLAVLAIVRLAELYLPQQGLYLVAAIAGTTDVDAITLSMTELAKDQAKLSLAASAIVIATLSNTVVKALMVAILGSKMLAQKVGVAAGAMVFAGVLGLVFA